MHGHTAHGCHDVGNGVGVHNLTLGALAACPLVVERLQFLLQACLAVAVGGGLLIVLGLHGSVFEGFHLLNILLFAHNFRRHGSMAQTHLGTCFVHGVNGLVGECTSSYITCCEAHAGV